MNLVVDMLVYTGTSLAGVVLFTLLFLAATGRINWKNIFEDLRQLKKR